MAIGNGIGLPFTSMGGGGGGASYPIDSLTDTTNLVGSWSVEKAFASTYADTNAILGAKMFTSGTERDFTGDSVEAGDVATWNSDTKAVITDMYDQSGNGNDWATTTLSRMPVYIDTTQVTMDNGSRAMEMINGYGLEHTKFRVERNGWSGVAKNKKAVRTLATDSCLRLAMMRHSSLLWVMLRIVSKTLGILIMRSTGR